MSVPPPPPLPLPPLASPSNLASTGNVQSLIAQINSGIPAPPPPPGALRSRVPPPVAAKPSRKPPAPPPPPKQDALQQGKSGTDWSRGNEVMPSPSLAPPHPPPPPPTTGTSGGTRLGGTPEGNITIQTTHELGASSIEAPPAPPPPPMSQKRHSKQAWAETLNAEADTDYRNITSTSLQGEGEGRYSTHSYKF